MLYFKIKVGFGANDYIKIDQDDYLKAVRSQGTGKVAVFKNGETASGSAILTILPDYTRSMGYKPEYQISIDEVPKKLLTEYEDFGKTVYSQLENGVKKLN